MTLRRLPRRPKRAFWAWLVATACLAAHGASQSSAEPPAAFDINVLDREIVREMRDNEKLHGAWLFVEQEAATDAGPGKFVFRRVLDRGRAAEQRAELDALIRAWAPPGGFRVDAAQDREYPFSALLTELRLAVETEPRLGGCMIVDAHYALDANDPSKLNMMLRGRIAKEGQDVEIEALCGRLMREDPAWVKRAAAGEAAAPNPPEADFIPLAISPQSAELHVVEPSEANGRWFYGAGMNHFWRGEYAQASQSFRQAALESPRKLQYCYWWIVSDLAWGDLQLARRRMATAVERFRDSDFDRQSPEYLAVVRSLERVQGPLRRQLLKLETEALLRDARAGND